MVRYVIQVQTIIFSGLDLIHLGKIRFGLGLLPVKLLLILPGNQENLIMAVNVVANIGGKNLCTQRGTTGIAQLELVLLFVKSICLVGATLTED
jgi:hypothetical protein